MDSGQIISNLIIMLITFVFATFFVAAEFALVQTRPSVLEEEQDKRDKKSKKIDVAIRMVHNLNEYLSTTQVGTTLCGIILGWIGEETVAQLLIDLFGAAHLSLNATVGHAIGSVVGIILLTYFEVVVTEIVPKNIAIDRPFQVMMVVVTPLRYFHVAFYPFVWLLNTSANGIVRMLGMQPASESDEAFSQAEILNLSRNAVTGGELDQEDYVFMQRAFEMNDKVARDIMIDRTQLEVIDVTDTVKDALQVYLTEQFSRLPVVADGDKDKILGYVYNYDLIRQSQADDSISVAKILRNIITVPETMPIQDVLQQMIIKQTPIVVVVDEYGGTSGIVTDKDIYEELFGTVHDEIDDVSDEYIFKQDDGSYHVSGKMTLYDFERYFQTDIKAFEESEVVTLTGYIIEKEPDIKAGDHYQIGDFQFTALDYENAYINWFEVIRKPVNQDEAATSSANEPDE